MKTKLEPEKQEGATVSEYQNQTEAPSPSIESLLNSAREHLEEADAILKKEKILVIEDSADARRMLTALLETEDFAVTAMESGRKGLKAAGAERPDLIIVDVNMPGLSGIETIRLLREQPELSEVPILAISAYGQWALARAVEAGADYTMNKPIEPDLLVENVKRLLDQKQ